MLVPFVNTDNTTGSIMSKIFRSNSLSDRVLFKLKSVPLRRSNLTLMCYFVGSVILFSTFFNLKNRHHGERLAITKWHKSKALL
jgi:hypothetical protein